MEKNTSTPMPTSKSALPSLSLSLFPQSSALISVSGPYVRWSFLRSSLKPSLLGASIRPSPILHQFSMSADNPSSIRGDQEKIQGKSSVHAEDLGIETLGINTASRVNLSSEQRLLVGSVLDLFKGRPSFKKLQLWTDSATFEDPLTKAQGRYQYEAQWYGLNVVFSEIEQLHSQVTSAGNPIIMDLETRYKIKGIGKEKIIKSKVMVHTDESCSHIVGVEDRWNGEIPVGVVANAFRHANSLIVPQLVSVPKSDTQDVKMEN